MFRVLCLWLLSPAPLQFVDSDNLLTNPRVLNLMMAENLTLVAPMLESRSLYSNFWCGMTPQVQLNSTLRPSTNPDLLISLPFFKTPSFMSGLLQANPRLPANQGVEAARLLPRSHGAQHLPIGPASWIQQGPGFLPPSPRLQLGIWWHHSFCLLGTSSRSVWISLLAADHKRREMPYGSFTVLNSELSMTSFMHLQFFANFFIVQMFTVV